MRRGWALPGVVVAACWALGQPSAPLPGFEVVSIKPDKSGDLRMNIHPSPGGRFTATNVTAKALIEWAYGMREFQLSGEPAWADSERFDVAAKADGNPRYDFLQPQLETMFRGVLADRFQLAVHSVTKELPVYHLLVAKHGPKIHAVDEGDCPEVPNPQNPCRFLRPAGFGKLAAQKAPLPALALVLTGLTRRTVLDGTELKGSFTYTLDWTKYIQPLLLPPGAGPPPPATFDPTSIELGISTALEEQLGLKLESGKGPVETLVVDHIERPTEN